MARSRTIQNSLANGIISPKMKARRDLESYYNAVEEAENVVIEPQGGMRRRDGLVYQNVSNDVATNGNGRLFVFEFSITQRYLFLFHENDMLIYSLTGTLLYTWAGWNATATLLEEMDIIQSADTVIVTHNTMGPVKIQRAGSDTSWNVSINFLKNMPYYDEDDTLVPRYFNYGDTQTVDIEIGDVVWFYDTTTVKGTKGYLYQALAAQTGIDLATQDYTSPINWDDLGERPQLSNPGVCTFHQGRLWLAGFSDKVTAVIGSVINDYFNFDLGYGRDTLPDDGIFDIIDTEQYNGIQNIISGRNLMVMTASAEYINTASVISPTTSAWSRQTGYGSKRLRPVNLDGSIYFVDRYGHTLRNFLYNDTEAGYQSVPISIQAENLINDVQDIAYQRGTTEAENSLVYIVNGDGTLAVLNLFRSSGRYGFTKWTTPGGLFKAVENTYEYTYFLVERDGVEYLEILSPYSYLDHSFVTTFIPDSDVIEVDSYLYGKEIRVTLDGELQSTTEVFLESGTYNAYADEAGATIVAGLNYDVSIKTLPISLSSQSEGNITHLPKRVTRCFLDLYQSRGVYINNILLTSRYLGSSVLDTEFPIITGQEEIRLLGYDRTGQITITQDDPHPLTLLGIDLEISY